METEITVSKNVHCSGGPLDGEIRTLSANLGAGFPDYFKIERIDMEASMAQADTPDAQLVVRTGIYKQTAFESVYVFAGWIVNEAH